MKKLEIFNVKGIVILVVLLTLFDLAIAFGLSGVVSGVATTLINKNVDAEVKIESIRIHPVLFSVSMSGVEIFDPENSSKRILYGEKASASLDLVSLLSKQVFLSNLNFKNIELEVVKDAKGTLNIQKITKPAETEPAPSKMAGLLEKIKSGGKKDWFGNFYTKLKSFLAKLKNKKEKGAETAIEKDITELPRGKKVSFDSPHTVLFQIKSLKLDGGKVVLVDRTAMPPLKDIHIRLKNFKMLKSGGFFMDELALKGRLESERKGSFNIHMKRKGDAVKTSADLKNLDLALLRPFYEDSSPVSFKKGYLSLDSKSSLKSDALNSKNNLVLDAYEMEAKSKFSLTGVSTQAIVEALNLRDHFEIKFEIGGTPDKPSFKGFEDSLLDMVKEDLQPGKIADLKEKAGDKINQLSDKVKSLF